jgi:hypothetical protein
MQGKPLQKVSFDHLRNAATDDEWNNAVKTSFGLSARQDVRVTT